MAPHPDFGAFRPPESQTQALGQGRCGGQGAVSRRPRKRGWLTRGSARRPWRRFPGTNANYTIGMKWGQSNCLIVLNARHEASTPWQPLSGASVTGLRPSTLPAGTRASPARTAFPMRVAPVITASTLFGVRQQSHGEFVGELRTNSLLPTAAPASAKPLRRNTFR